MSQLDNIPPIRLPEFTPFPMEDAFRGVSDSFKIRTPEADMLPASLADAQAVSPHPFQVFVSSTTDPAAPKARVLSSSRLYRSLSTTDTQSITGLNTDITLANNTRIWLQVTVSSLATTAASIQSGSAFPALVVLSGSNQTQFNVPIGRVTASAPTAPGFEFDISGTTYHFEQCLFSHLLAENRCNSGTAIIYGFPFGGAA